MPRGLVPALLAFLAVPAAADPMPMSAGAVPGPLRSTEVALVREDLHIDVTRKHVEVTAALQLRNAGAATKLYVAFPCDRGLEPGMAGLDCKTRIAVKVGGKKVSTRRETTSDKQTYWMWPMKLAAGQEVALVVSYRTPLRNDRYETPFFGLGTVFYRLRTGATWAGPIGELTMRIDLPMDAVAHIAPAGYTREHGRISWTLRDVEPADDVALLFHPIYLGRAAAAVKADTGDALRAAIARGAVDRGKLAEVARQLRSEADEVVEFAAFFHKVARARLGLPEPKEAEVRACVEASAALLEHAAAATGK